MHIYKSALAAALSLICLTGCSREKFNPYRHMTTILTVATKEQFELDQFYIMQHTAPDLQDQLYAALDGTIYDSNYSMEERQVYSETETDFTKLIAEYDYTSSTGEYLVVAYFKYEKDILVDFEITPVQKVVDWL